MTEKEFDAWNIEKKTLSLNGQNKFYHQRDIWWCTFGINIGFEQDGTGKNYERPAVVLRGFSKHVCLVVPLTTSKKSNKYHFSLGLVDGREAFSIISQIRLVDTKRLSNKIGVMDGETFLSMKKAIKDII